MAFLNELMQQPQQPQQVSVGSQDPSIFGGSSDFLQQLLRRQSTGVAPGVGAARKAFAGASGRTTDRGLRSIRENQAASGFRGGDSLDGIFSQQGEID